MAKPEITGRERMQAIFNGGADRPAFWHGNPHDDTNKIYWPYFGVQDDLELGIKLGDDFAWMYGDMGWKHPEGAPMFDVLGGKPRTSLSQPGIFAETTDIAEVEAFPWPELKYLDFTELLARVDRARAAGKFVLSGMWAPFFHVVADYFGMENYFAKMFTDPAVVEAVTEHVVDFYLQANELYFQQIGTRMDGYFFGNDFGSQLDLLISPKLFQRFVLPYFVKFVDQAKRHNYRVVLHSCGAVDKAIPYLIDAGVEGLHPLQALARGMEATNLSRKYKGKLVFIGGVDTQQLLPFGTPQQVRDEVRRLKDLFGPQFVVSPSHEALLPNVPVENLIAMAETAQE